MVAAAPSRVALGGGTVALLGAGAELSWTRAGERLAITHAAGAVTYQHPGPAPLAISTPGAAIDTRGASLRVEAPLMPTRSQLLIGGAAVTAAAVVVIAVYDGTATVRQPGAPPVEVGAGGEVAVTATPGRPPFTPVARAVKDRAQRDALAAAIASARAARAAPPGAAPGPGGAPTRAGPAGAAPPTAPAAPAIDLTPGELSKDEIRAGVREVIPMLTECYTAMLDRHPRVGGRVVARLVVDAEPELGTIVTMLDDTEITLTGADPTVARDALDAELGEFRQCLGATLEAMALPPLGDKDGGRVEITYPFTFAPSEDDPRATPP